MRWKKASEISTYAVEVQCTRCEDTYIREVKQGEGTRQIRTWKGDTQDMCRRCKTIVNTLFWLVAAPVVLVVTIILVAVT